MSSDNVKEFGEASTVTMDEFLRTALGQMFECDNDTSELVASLEATDGSTSELKFEIRITEINGVKCREDED